MKGFLKSRREVLYARISMSELVIRDSNGSILHQERLGMNDDPAIPLKRAGYYIVMGGYPPMLVPGQPITVLVRRRVVGGPATLG